MAYIGLGFFASSLITSTRLPFKVAVGGFIVGQVLFVLPLYLTAIYGRNQYLSKIMPVGGVSMVLSWLGLLFAWSWQMGIYYARRSLWAKLIYIPNNKQLISHWWLVKGMIEHCVQHDITIALRLYRHSVTIRTEKIVSRCWLVCVLSSMLQSLLTHYCPLDISQTRASYPPHNHLRGRKGSLWPTHFIGQHPDKIISRVMLSCHQ